MKLFYVEHSGVWRDNGTSLVVAEDETKAKSLVEEKLAPVIHRFEVFIVKEIDTEKPALHILSIGKM